MAMKMFQSTGKRKIQFQFQLFKTVIRFNSLFSESMIVDNSARPIKMDQKFLSYTIMIDNNGAVGS